MLPTFFIYIQDFLFNFRYTFFIAKCTITSFMSIKDVRLLQPLLLSHCFFFENMAGCKFNIKPALMLNKCHHHIMINAINLKFNKYCHLKLTSFDRPFVYDRMTCLTTIKSNCIYQNYLPRIT